MMTVKTDIFLFTPWFPHLALFQRLKRKCQDGSNAAITLVQHPLHRDTPSCPGRGMGLAVLGNNLQLYILECHLNIFKKECE